jgi:hypothetical protein
MIFNAAAGRSFWLRRLVVRDNVSGCSIRDDARRPFTLKCKDRAR